MIHIAKKRTRTLDLEPSWESLCLAVQRGALNAECLMPVCKAADIIRQAQKNGKKRIVFTFSRGTDGTVDVKEED